MWNDWKSLFGYDGVCLLARFLLLFTFSTLYDCFISVFITFISFSRCHDALYSRLICILIFFYGLRSFKIVFQLSEPPRTRAKRIRIEEKKWRRKTTRRKYSFVRSLVQCINYGNVHKDFWLNQLWYMLLLGFSSLIFFSV